MSVSWGVNFWDHQQRFIVKKYHFTSFLKNQGGQLPTFSVRIPFPKISFISLANKVSKEQMRFSDVAHVRATQKKIYIPFNGVYFYNSSAVVPNASSSLQFQKFSWCLATLRLIIVLHEEKTHFCFNYSIHMQYINSFWTQLLLSRNSSIFHQPKYRNKYRSSVLNEYKFGTYMILLVYFPKSNWKVYNTITLYCLNYTFPLLLCQLLYHCVHTFALRWAVKVYYM